MILDPLVFVWLEKQATNIGDNFLNGKSLLDNQSKEDESFTLREDGKNGIHLLKGEEHSIKLKSPAMKTLKNTKLEAGPEIDSLSVENKGRDFASSLGEQNPIGLNFKKRTV